MDTQTALLWGFGLIGILALVGVIVVIARRRNEASRARADAEQAQAESADSLDPKTARNEDNPRNDSV